MADDIDKFCGDRSVKTSGLLNHLDMRMNAGDHADFLSKVYDYAKWVFFVTFADNDHTYFVFTLSSVRR